MSRAQIHKLVKEYVDCTLSPKPFLPGETHIPPSGKLIDYEEVVNIVDAALDGFLTEGRFNEAFEKALSDFIGVNHVLTVNSGSSANLVAFTTLTSSRLGERAIKKGDEVISVAAGFPTTVNPIIQFGAVPVFIDVEIPTYNINYSLIESAITSKTKAIMIAHTLGNPFNLKVVTDICKKYNLWLVEDCCDALGSLYDNKLVGTFGDISTVSFYPAHHITMGEGGAVFTNNEELYHIARSIRDWGRDCYCPPARDNTCGKRYCWKLGDLPFGYDHKYTYSHLGYNLKITDMQAACGLAQLKKLPKFIDSRRRNFNKLQAGLQNCTESLILPSPTENSNPSWFGFPISIRDDSSIDRQTILNYLHESNIGTRLLFAGNIIRQPYMNNVLYRKASDLKVSDFIMNNTFWIGVQPALSDEMIDFTINKLQNICGVNF